MAVVAGALARASKLFVEGCISESEFANRMPPEEDTEGNPARSDGEDEDEDTDPEDVGEMDIEGWDAIEKFPFKDSKEIMGATLACKFDAKYGGWARGTVRTLDKSGENNGMYGVKFVGEQLIRFLELREDDYDTDDIWVPIRKAS